MSAEAQNTPHAYDPPVDDDLERHTSPSCRCGLSKHNPLHVRQARADEAQNDHTQED
jgi:hypothetical protein